MTKQIKSKNNEDLDSKNYEDQIISLKEINNTKNDLCDTLRTSMKNIDNSIVTENNLLKKLK